MRVIVLYDSLHGNTKLVAQAIGAAIGDEAMVLSVTDTAPSDLELIDLLIIGAPTHGSLPSKPIYEYIKELSDAVITGLKTAVFDTRKPVRFITIFGFAAGKMAKQLKKKGAVIIEPEGDFRVTGIKGPLKDGELERAAQWAKDVVIAAKA